MRIRLFLATLLCCCLWSVHSYGLVDFDVKGGATVFNAVTATGDSTVVASTGYSLATINIITASGTVAATPKFSPDGGTTFVTATCYNPAGTSFTSFIATGVFWCAIVNSDQFKITLVTCTTCTFTVKVTLGDAPPPTLGGSVTIGANQSVNLTQIAGVAPSNSNPLNTQGRQATTGAVLADLAVTVASQAVVASSATRMGIICWNQGASPNAIRIGFGATPTATTGYFMQWGTGFTDTGTYAINAIRDTGATGNPTLSCSTVSQ